jgi:sugar lactone lactonase YvrE
VRGIDVATRLTEEETTSMRRFAICSAVLMSGLALPVGARADTVSDVPAQGLVLPAAVAAYGRDRFVVADAAEQRIFIIDTNGATRVLAGGGTPNELGSVAGGFADGPGEAARFNSPQGVAADAHGDVYVADTGNHCIRKITPDGVVTTLAGSPTRQGAADGPALDATFRAPRGLTLDTDGALLVADGLGSIRAVTPAGRVRTVQIHVNSPFDLAVVSRFGQRYYVVSDLDGLVVAPPSGTGAGRYNLDNIESANARGLIGGPLGHPYDVAAYGTHSIAYTDRYTGGVHLLDLDFNIVRSIGTAEAGAPQIGTAFGIRALADGHGVVVADAATRRLEIVRLDPDHDREPFAPTGNAALPPPPDHARIRVVLLGGSMIWWATEWPSSIEGRAERELNAWSPKRKIEVLPIVPYGATASAQLTYAAALCEAHMADVIVVDLNSALLRMSYPISGPVSTPAAVGLWSDRLHTSAMVVDTECRHAGVKFAVALSPMYDEVSASENAMFRLLSTDVSTDPDAHARYLDALSGVPVIDLWPAFTAAEGNGPPLYIAGDTHLSAAGRAAFATAFAGAVEGLIGG